MRQLTKEQGHLAARRMMQASWELSQRLQRGEHPQATRITTPPPPSHRSRAAPLQGQG